MNFEDVKKGMIVEAAEDIYALGKEGSGDPLYKQGDMFCVDSVAQKGEFPIVLEREGEYVSVRPGEISPVGVRDVGCREREEEELEGVLAISEPSHAKTEPQEEVLIVEDSSLVKTERIEVRRTLLSRLFGRPWNPLRKTDIVEREVPREDVIHGAFGIVAHPEVAKRLRKEMGAGKTE